MSGGGVGGGLGEERGKGSARARAEECAGRTSCVAVVCAGTRGHATRTVKPVKQSRRWIDVGLWQRSAHQLPSPTLALDACAEAYAWLRDRAAVDGRAKLRHDSAANADVTVEPTPCKHSSGAVEIRSQAELGDLW